MDQDLIPVPEAWWRQIWFVHYEVERRLPGLPWLRSAQLHVTHQRGWRALPGGRGPQQQFFWTISGCGRCRIGQRHADLPPGTGIIYDTREPDLAIDLPADAQRPWMWLRVACEGAEAAVADLVRRHGRRFQLPADAAALRFVRSLRTPPGNQPILGPAVSAELTVRFLSLLDQDLAPAAGNGLVRRARRICDAGLEIGITVKQLAAQLGVTPEHLARVFHRELGESPSAHLRRIRLMFAERLLSDPRQSISHIASRLGYATPSHFARAFRAGTGQSPQAWRQHGGDLA